MGPHRVHRVVSRRRKGGDGHAAIGGVARRVAVKDLPVSYVVGGGTSGTIRSLMMMVLMTIAVLTACKFGATSAYIPDSP